MTIVAGDLDNVRARVFAIFVCAIALPAALWAAGVPLMWCAALAAADVGLAFGTLARWDRLPRASVRDTVILQITGAGGAMLAHVLITLARGGPLPPIFPFHH